jgi:hypothetical protein
VVAADRGNKQAKTLSPYSVSTGYITFDGTEAGSPAPFAAPEAVAADLQGFIYIFDRSSSRVLRYDTVTDLEKGRSVGYVQTVNVELNSFGQPLADPVTVGVDDSVAYVGDRGRGQVIRYKRRP